MDIQGVRHNVRNEKSADEDVIPVILSGQSPELCSVSGSSSIDPLQTLPKSPLLAITRLSRGARPSPVTRILCGPAGSLLITVRVADLTPTPVGWKRMTTSVDVPARTFSG